MNWTKFRQDLLLPHSFNLAFPQNRMSTSVRSAEAANVALERTPYLATCPSIPYMVSSDV